MVDHVGDLELNGHLRLTWDAQITSILIVAPLTLDVKSGCKRNNTSLGSMNLVSANTTRRDDNSA